MRIAKEELVAALGLRYDHHSASTMFEVARNRAELADKPDYDAAEVAAFRAALARVGDRLDKVNARLDVLTGNAPVAAPPPAEEPKVEKAEAKVEEPKVEAKAEEPRADAPKKKEKGKKGGGAEPAATVVSLSGLELGDGDELLMCGDFVGWDIEQARPLTRAGDRYQASLELDPGTEIAFKFLRRTPSGDVAWEPGENRTVVGGGKLEATWRAARVDD